jgi:hypothetical protein
MLSPSNIYPQNIAMMLLYVNIFINELGFIFLSESARFRISWKAMVEKEFEIFAHLLLCKNNSKQYINQLKRQS